MLLKNLLKPINLIKIISFIFLTILNLALITTPSISQTPDGSIQVQWRSTGNGRGVYGYRILFRTANSGWNPFG